MRGQSTPEGVTRVAPNGYQYIRTSSGWRLTHHVVAEKTLGRPIREDERVFFLDKDRTNFDPANIQVQKKVSASSVAKIAKLRAKISELQAELDELEDHEATRSQELESKGSLREV